ncbi:MAG: hypothetical protein HGB11_08265 [Chlorobiales bacterium]|nr:hypothetical protein [Chlorobiales bacterium]
MEILLNDLSIHGQFQDIKSFFNAIDRLMVARNTSMRFGRELYCHRNMAYAQVTKDLNMPQAVQQLSPDKKKALILWLTKSGPYWDDTRLHNSDDYMECVNQIVTDTAIGEAAFRQFHGGDCHLFSIIPSNWEYTTLLVLWYRVNGDRTETDVDNYINSSTLENALRLAPKPIQSWEMLGETCRIRFPHIVFASDAFEPFQGHPFVPGAANQLIDRFEILAKYLDCFDINGERTEEGDRLYRDFFTGEKAWFTDSSSDEKNDFKSDLTFKHPDIQGQTIFCPWHGKVKSPQLRIHFSWPIYPNEPLYVVYVGPKITKR